MTCSVCFASTLRHWCRIVTIGKTSWVCIVAALSVALQYERFLRIFVVCCCQRKLRESGIPVRSTKRYPGFINEHWMWLWWWWYVTNAMSNPPSTIYHLSSNESLSQWFHAPTVCWRRVPDWSFGNDLILSFLNQFIDNGFRRNSYVDVDHWCSLSSVKQSCPHHKYARSRCHSS